MELKPATGDVIVNNFGIEIDLIVEVIEQVGRQWKVVTSQGHETYVITTGKPGKWTVGI